MKSETNQIIEAISDVLVEKLDELRTELKGEIADLRSDMNRRFDHMHGNLSAAIDLVAVRVPSSPTARTGKTPRRSAPGTGAALRA